MAGKKVSPAKKEVEEEARFLVNWCFSVAETYF